MLPAKALLTLLITRWIKQPVPLFLLIVMTELVKQW